MTHAIIIGAQKSGTTSLINYLVRSPEIVCHDLGHESSFFSNPKNNGKTADEYFDMFPHCDRGKVTIEKSADYLHFPNAPKRAAEICPDAKVICMLRNPIDRAWSHYWHEVKHNESETKQFKNAIQRPIYNDFDRYYFGYLLIGQYVDHIKNWRQNFCGDERQYFFIIAEKFFSNPGPWVAAVLDFLGAKPLYFDHYPVFMAGDYRCEMEHEIRAVLAEYFKPYNDEIYKLANGEKWWS